MILNEMNSIFREHMNYNDSDTVKAIAEASDQNQLLTALTSKLYDKIVEKADKIDFSTVSRSRGDITKIENYNSLMECIDIIRNIVVQYKENVYPVDVISNAVENIKSRTDIFKKAFVINAPLPIMIYNSIVTAIVTSVSFLIATCIEYVKSPQAESFQIALDAVAYHKTFENLLFENLDKFNEACKNNDMDSTLKFCIDKSRIKHESADVEIKHDDPFMSDDDINSTEEDKVVIHDKKENLNEGVFSNISYNVSRVLLFIAKYLINIIRSLVYYYYASRQKISDFYTTQAELLEMNACQLQYNNTIDVDRRRKIYDKQMKIADKFRNKANKFNVDYTSSRKIANDIANKEAREYTIKDLDNYNPNMENIDISNSILF